MSKFNLQHGVNVIAQAIPIMPSSPGVYKMISADGIILYVGKAKILPKRVIAYTMVEKLPYRLKMMVSQVNKVEFLITETEAQALLLEADLIQINQPRYNILLKDDKSFPYISIQDNHPFPRIGKYRGNKKDNDSYYGPFACVKAVDETLVELQKAFKLRSCSNSYFTSRIRPCLQYQLHRCSAPCVDKIDQANYHLQVQQARDFLNGENSRLQMQLKKQMQAESEALEYEKAAEIRDRIKILSQIQARNITATGNLIHADIFALYQDDDGNSCLQVFFIMHGKNFGNKFYFLPTTGPANEMLEEFILQFYHQHPPAPVIVLSHSLKNKKSVEEALKVKHNLKTKIIGIKSSEQIKDLVDFALGNAKESLQQQQREATKQQLNLQLLQRTFSLNKLPNLIEVYDNSHLQGSHAFGCYIATENGAFNKKLYRTFRITSDQGKLGDDYAMMDETISRRFKNLKEGNKPDLLIIDGGKGQLTCVLNTLKKLNWLDVEVICMSKGVDRNSGREFFHIPGKDSFQLPVGDQVLAYLHQLRNEAHRFAITTHRKSISKSVSISGMDAIPGIGKARKTSLLSHFGSLELLRKASIIDMARIPGISKKMATMIFTYLHHYTNRYK